MMAPLLLPRLSFERTPCHIQLLCPHMLPSTHTVRYMAGRAATGAPAGNLLAVMPAQILKIATSRHSAVCQSMHHNNTHGTIVSMDSLSSC